MLRPGARCASVADELGDSVAEVVHDVLEEGRAVRPRDAEDRLEVRRLLGGSVEVAEELRAVVVVLDLLLGELALALALLVECDDHDLAIRTEQDGRQPDFLRVLFQGNFSERYSTPCRFPIHIKA